MIGKDYYIKNKYISKTNKIFMILIVIIYLIKNKKFWVINIIYKLKIYFII